MMNAYSTFILTKLRWVYPNLFLSASQFIEGHSYLNHQNKNNPLFNAFYGK